jgi:hypothetical protein
MSTFYAQSLVEHPGHSDQSVHGRRTGSKSTGKVNLVHVGRSKGAFDTGKGAVTFNRQSFKSKTYANPSKSSMKRLGRVLKKSTKYTQPHSFLTPGVRFGIK